MSDISGVFKVHAADDSQERKNPDKDKKDKNKKIREIDQKIGDLVKEAIKENVSKSDIAEIKHLQTILEKNGVEDVAIEMLQILKKKI